jgi:hypothetical protein
VNKRVGSIVVIGTLALAGCAGATQEPTALPTCTPPYCQPGEVYWCPQGPPCGCDTRCATPTVGPTDPAPTPTDTAPGPSFEASTYRDFTLGFELDYPSEWTLSEQVEQGSRGEAVQLLQDGEPTLQIATYRWTPDDDLDAYVASRKVAWDSSGMSIESESELLLAGDRRALSFVIRTQEGDRAFFLFTIVDFTVYDGRYLVLSGEGDPALLAEIGGTVRRLDCLADGEDSPLWIACNVMDGIRSRNLSALHNVMADPFVIGYWGSEGREDTPAGITDELAQHRLPADTSTPIAFTTNRALFPPLAGQAPEDLFGPDVEVALVIYSEGWGVDGQGAALLHIARNEAGAFYWHGMVYSGQHFDK